MSNSPSTSFSEKKCFIGFDGFTDHIIDVVDKRLSVSNYSTLPTISSFGEKISRAAGQSCNFELVVKDTKLGGNGPIMANALVSAGYSVTFAGCVGTEGHIDAPFIDFVKSCNKVFPLLPSAHSDAIEFQDGKVMLGRLTSLDKLTYSYLLEAIGKENLIATFNESHLIATVNWTMTPFMTEIWEGLLSDIVPQLDKTIGVSRRYFFVDLADPARRSDTELKHAISTLEKLNATFSVILGLNFAEAQRLARVLGCDIESERLVNIIKNLYADINIDQIVVHSKGIAAAIANDDTVFQSQAAICSHPVLSTGAGDNFNAGYCSALLQGLSIKECLDNAMASAGHYVRHGVSK